MSAAVSLVFPHQLFQENPALQKGRTIYLVEEWLFFRQYNFHQQKLVLHRASMQFYQQWLIDQGFQVIYIDTNDLLQDCRQLVKQLANEQTTEIHVSALVDDWLEKRLVQSCGKNQIELIIHNSPNFLNSKESVESYFSKRKTYFQTDFYTWQRKERKLLLEADGKPIGGQWTFDSGNRKPFPKKGIAPAIQQFSDNAFLVEARTYVQQHFPNNYGTVNGPHLFVTSFQEAQQWLEDFIIHRFEHFGIYEDAIVTNETVLHHSVLTPMLNIGLLNPQQVLDRVIEQAEQYQIPLNSLEGFIRQVMGWREFIHLVYEREGDKQRTTNYWKFSRKIPEGFWTGNTGIAPIDCTIKKILATGYCHHIERLMVLGNFMLLCEFDPDQVYQWFMELFIDAYDWVMVPNVYGMTQFADGGLMTTKPYISGSNYLMKMSDYPKGDWQPIWDGLFWRFMHVHRDFFLKNPRLGMLVKTFDKMSPEKQQLHLLNAERFLKELDEQLK
jgi:deoxyribodipyrimidine photolyase-related protein